LAPVDAGATHHLYPVWHSFISQGFVIDGNQPVEQLMK